jgi:hypothetical protein
VAAVSGPPNVLDAARPSETLTPTAPAGDELSRLRHTSALNSEIVASLRALRDNELQRSAEQAALLAGVVEQLHSHWQALSEQHSAANLLGQVSEPGAALLEDLLDYTRAAAGTLTLDREPVHLGRLLRQAVTQACTARGLSSAQASIEIQPNVPERVLTDGPRLSKVLVQLIGAVLESSDRAAFSLMIQPSAAADEPGMNRGGIAITLKAASPPAAQQAKRGALSEAARLRAALAERLCAYMNGSLKEEEHAAGERCWYLTLPLEASEDPVQASELARARATPARTVLAEARSDRAAAANQQNSAANSPIDFMYLDRQLGSLAQLVLARTAPAFAALADERLTRLVVAQQMGDRDRLRDLAQAWKASAMSVGGRSLAGLLGSVEKQAAAGHVPGEGAIRQIGDALDRLQQALALVSAAPASAR